VVKLMKTVVWHDQGSETVSQRLRDVDEADSGSWFVDPEVGCGISKGVVSDAMPH